MGKKQNALALKAAMRDDVVPQDDDANNEDVNSSLYQQLRAKHKALECTSHPLHYNRLDGTLIAPWVKERTHCGTAIVCNICGKFYGYLRQTRKAEP